MRADHPLAGQAEVDVGDLREQSFILYYDPIREGIRTGDIQTDGFLRHCQQAGFVPKLEIISKNISELRNVCVENFNWVYLPHLPAELDASLFPDSGCPTEGSPVWL